MIGSHFRSSLVLFLLAFHVVDLLELLGLSISLLLHLLVSLLRSHASCLSLDQHVLVVLLVEVGQALDHGVDLFLLLVHEGRFEGALCGQLKSLEQVVLSSLVNSQFVVENTDSLLLLEG